MGLIIKPIGLYDSYDEYIFSKTDISLKLF
ncbi:hypothetical protein IMSAG025_00011 [Muribaculaceae bacterium]|jgi:hypothetical protein|nr:hypothetical protein IMSAGC016_00830 [Muribaculaceae bacterium]GFI56586.1 hypothetical protein IMSAG025_00011 [Muribaculaceae bacterium]